jgi:hypothetical protein
MVSDLKFLAGEFPNCIFVLAMEPDVVAADIEVAYKDLMTRLSDRPTTHGWDTLGWRFLEKIVQLPLSLPPVDDGSRITFVRGLLNTPIGQSSESPRATSPATNGRASDGTPATVPVSDSPLPEHHPAQRPAPPDYGVVKKIETKIREERPDLESLQRIAHEAQTEVIGFSEQLGDAAVAAADRVFADLYSDKKAYQAIESGLPGLASTNPRKRSRDTSTCSGSTRSSLIENG